MIIEIDESSEEYCSAQKDNDIDNSPEQNNFQTYSKGSWSIPQIETKENYTIIVNPGKNLIGFNVKKPVDYFKLFFDNNILTTMVSNSNKKLKEKTLNRKSKYQDISIYEMEAYLGCMLTVNVKHRKGLKHHLKTNELASKGLLFWRFELITWVLGLKDCEVKTDDPLRKLKPFKDLFDENLRIHYQLGSEIIIDKNNLEYHKDNIPICHEMKGKWGFDVYYLADANTGYVQKTEVIHKMDNRIKSKQICLNMISGYENQGHHLYVDEHYTSFDLFDKFDKMRINATGIIKPHKCKSQNLQHVEKNNCTFMWRDDLLITPFKDELFCLSNVEIPIIVQPKDNNIWVPEISLLLDNFLRKRTCDKTAHSYYQKWWKNYFAYSVEIAVNNAYILYKNQCIANGFSHKSYKTFRHRIAHSLTKKNIKYEEKKKAKVEEQKQEQDVSKLHLPVKGSSRKYCKHCTVVASNLPQKTDFHCSVCNYYLHPECFMKYHELNINKIR